MGSDSYNRRRARVAARDREESRSGRDIGPLPKIANKRRRNAAGKSLRKFCETYHADRFALEWSDDHKLAIERMETAIRSGGLFALAMPRASGKTTLCEAAVEWAILYGYRSFVCIVGSDQDSALEILDSIKLDLETSELLAEDFPLACLPIQSLEGITHRCRGQLCDDKRTHIHWGAESIVLPTVAGSEASGAIIKARGITGRIRGMKHTRAADGKSVRPDLVIVDDPQTDESAANPDQCKKRERTIKGAVFGLAGPGNKIAGFIPCTVIVKDDLAERLLDNKLHPELQGQRCQMVYQWPTDKKAVEHWEEYARLRVESLEADGTIAKATAYYRKHRKAMDKGAKVGWPARMNADEISALQHAYNLKLFDELAFAAEYQNDPLDEHADDELLDAATIAKKIDGYTVGEIPAAATHLTGFIDVQGKCLYWLLAAWTDTFTGWVIDYGSFPDQRVKYFTLVNARRTLAKRYPRARFEGRLRSGIDELVEDLVGREYVRDDGAELSLSRLLIDANWGESTDIVYEAIRANPHRRILLPTHGIGVKATTRPMNDWPKKPSEQVGTNWRIRKTTERKTPVRHGIYDTNAWKTFIHQGLATAVGDVGSLSLPTGRDHRMLADHITAEFRQRRQVDGGRTVDEWKAKPGRRDNHLFDCLVGSAVGAAMDGARLPELKPSRPANTKKRRRGVSYLNT